jgi:hypothetical protein
MEYEIACDGPMSPEVRESHAGQKLAEEGGWLAWFGTG